MQLLRSIEQGAMLTVMILIISLKFGSCTFSPSDQYFYLDEIKTHIYPCLDLQLFSLQSAAMRRNEYPIGFSNEAISLKNKVTSCIPEWNRIINKKLDSLGLVGQLIRRWMPIMTNFGQKIDPLWTYEIHASMLEMTLGKELEKFAKSSQIPTSRLGNLHLNPEASSSSSAQQEPAASAPSSPKADSESIELTELNLDRPIGSLVSDMTKDIDFGRTSYPVKLSKRTFETGLGYCIHLREDTLGFISSFVRALLNMESEFEVDLGGAIINEPLISGINWLRYCCDLLHEVPYDVESTFAMLQGNYDNPGLREAHSTLDFFKTEPNANPMKPEFECKFEHIEKLLKVFKYFNIIKIVGNTNLIQDMSLLINSLIGRCIVELEPEFLPLIEPLKKVGAFNGDFDELMAQFELAVQNHDPPEFDTFPTLFNTRIDAISDTMFSLFFSQQPNFKRFDPVETFKTGDKICQVFDSIEWRQIIDTENKLVEFFQILNEYYFTPSFNPFLSTNTSKLFVAWKICDLIRMFPYENIMYPPQVSDDED